MIKLISMQITVVSHKFLNKTIKFVKMFFLKLFKINLNIVLEIVVFGICSYVLIELVYYILIQDVMIIYLNVYTIIMKNF